MVEKYVTTRVKQKTATLAEWQTMWNTFTPLRGEQCIFIIPAQSEEAVKLGFTLSSSVRHVSKTGDGTTLLASLPWDNDIVNVSQSVVNNETNITRLSALVGEESVATQITTAFDDRLFVGTLEQYNIANSQGLIKIGAIVILTDPEEDNKDDDNNNVEDDTENSNDTTSVLGLAVLGKMILG